MFPATALAPVQDLGRYPYLCGNPEKGEDPPQDGIVALQQVLTADDQHPVLVEEAVEIA